jgi:hypothetical protein
MRTLPTTWSAACGVAAATLLPLLVLPTAAGAAPRPALDITTVSSRLDAVTGGDALVRVDVPSGVAPGAVRVQRNGSDVTRGFRVVNGDLLGLVDGLAPGRHRLTATAPRARTATVAVTAHPGTGPLFSGPREQPFACETTEYRTPAGAQVGEPLDEDCSIATRVEYLYRTTDPASQARFKPLPEGARPADLATTTTVDDRTVPYIVRVQIGTANRGIYEMATLHDPARPEPTAFSRSSGWNGRLVYTFGGGCRAGWYQQGSSTGGVMVDTMLSRGFAVASNTLNVFGNNCSDLLTSETLSMTREEFIESYGPPQYTMGWGCSGGSYQSHQAADAYPGLLDGIVVGCSFPDVGFATSQMLADTRLLHEFFRSDEQGSASFTQEQQLAVSGFGEHESIASQSGGAARLDPDAEFDASTPASARYDAPTNPTGARATVWDHTRNAYGVDPATGFARRPLDNVGVQYGLEALRAGTITIDQFLELNEGIGGLDIDGNVQDERMAADPQARRAAYQTGRILDGGGGLATTPIIDHRAYTDLLGVGDIHQRYHSFSTRERLIEANGDADNQVMLVRDNSYGLFSPDDPVLVYALEQMDRWILEAQASGADTHREVVEAKPEGLEDSCWEPGRLDSAEEFGSKRIVEQIRPDAGRCHELYPTFASPRIVAGGPLASDVITCRTTQPRRRDYPAMRDTDWQRLLAVFPNGVCNYDRTGVDEQGMRGTWASFSAPGSWTFLEPRRGRAQH